METTATSTDAPKGRHVISALCAVQKALGEIGLAKDSTNKGMGFKYRSIDAVYRALTGLLSKNQIIISPEEVRTESDELNGRTRYLRVHYRFRVVSAVDDSSLCFESIGEGMDTGDKCSGKAASYAYKTAAFSLFCIPVEGAPDPDAESVAPEPPRPEPTDDMVRDGARRCTTLAEYQHFYLSVSPAQRKRVLVVPGIHDEIKAALSQK